MSVTVGALGGPRPVTAPRRLASPRARCSADPTPTPKSRSAAEIADPLARIMIFLNIYGSFTGSLHPVEAFAEGVGLLVEFVDDVLLLLGEALQQALLVVDGLMLILEFGAEPDVIAAERRDRS